MPLLSRLYYLTKPLLPRRLRIGLRRVVARRQRAACTAAWPIDPQAGSTPVGWPGWPGGKRFAVVLTHDVESRVGAGLVRQLAQLEEECGFRSSFNLVPEGGYLVLPDLREWLTGRGFEVGVHDLNHDGSLYTSREVFRRKAIRINRFLRDWGAVGFRSGFMMRRLSWMHDLEISYDASTFDTDPFEPEPEGAGTIFPFWVAGGSNQRPSWPLHNPSAADDGTLTDPATGLPIEGGKATGYLELPYTLPQDSTLFLLLRETTIEIWKRKLDWIAERGGMVLLNTHPDYMCFEETNRPLFSYAAGLYREFLLYLRERFADQYWSALPREVSSYVENQCRKSPELRDSLAASGRNLTGRKIWIDLDNTPHVPFFLPIIDRLRARGHQVVVTARDAFQVCELADLKGLKYEKVGKHYGKNRIAKVAGLFYRAMQLAPFALRERPALGLSHGARSQIIACNLLRIPTILVADYEFAKTPPLMRPRWEVMPEAIPAGAGHTRPDRIRHYPGIKEDVYAWTLKPDPAVLKQLGIGNEEMVVVVRPPATEAHYHSPQSEVMFQCAMERLASADGLRVVLLPRNSRQTKWIQTTWPKWFESNRVVVPAHAVDGLNLLWYSDLVISGGGTMNREAAALGVPVYSIFRGKIGAIDRHLAATGRLVLLESPDDVKTKLALVRRKRDDLAGIGKPGPALDVLVRHIEDILQTSR